jgi:hypothetical protein
VFIFMVLSESSAIANRNVPHILGRLFQSGPLRIAAVHVCSPDIPELHNITAKLVRQLQAKDRVRTRFHCGTLLISLTS